MNNAEFINKVIYDKNVSNTFASLWERWQCEKDYEDINEYGNVLHGAINKIDECMLFKTTKKPFGITVNPQNGCYAFKWAFKINPDQAKREGYDKTSVRGAVMYDPEFNGCPHCGSKLYLPNHVSISLYHVGPITP